MSRSRRPTRSRGNRSRTSRSTRSVPPPRYRIRGDWHDGQRVAGGHARPQWWQRSVVPGLVVDERPLAVRAGLDRAAVPAHDDRRGPAAVEDEDRPLAARGVERVERGGEHVGQQPPVARGELGPQVDGGHERLRPGGRHRQDDPPVPAGRGHGRRSRPTGVALPRTTAAPASRASSSAASRAWNRGVRSLL